MEIPACQGEAPPHWPAGPWQTSQGQATLGLDCFADKSVGSTPVSRLEAAHLISATAHATPEQGLADHPRSQAGGGRPRGGGQGQVGEEGPGPELEVLHCPQQHGPQRCLCLAHIFPEFPAVEGLPLPPPWRGSPGHPVRPGTSVLWEWLTALHVLLAPTPPVPTQQNVRSVPVATTAFQG